MWAKKSRRRGWKCSQGSTIKKAVTLGLLILGSYGCSEDEVSAYFNVDDLPSIYAFNDGFNSEFLLAPMDRYLQDDFATTLWNHEFFGTSFQSMRKLEDLWAEKIKAEKKQEEARRAAAGIRANHLAMTSTTFGKGICFLEDANIKILSDHLNNTSSLESWDKDVFSSWHEYGHCVLGGELAKQGRSDKMITGKENVYIKEVFADIYSMVMMERISGIDTYAALKRYRDKNLRVHSDSNHWTSPILDRWRADPISQNEAIGSEALLAWIDENDVYAIREKARR